MISLNEIYNNKENLPLPTIRMAALGWWNNTLNLEDRIIFQQKWFPKRKFDSLTGREIQQIWDIEFKYI
ncbi:MAG: hypothetical protein ACOCVF_01250 [bacterium]